MRGVGLSARLAWRYLLSKKSYSAVNAISIVAVTGVAVATAAIVCVLSVFNGFREVLGDRLDHLAPDVLVTPAEGKVFSESDSLTERIRGIDGVAAAMASLTDQALLIANSREMPITLKGVTAQEYGEITAFDNLSLEGINYKDATPDEASISVGVAQRMGIYNNEFPLLVFVPKREGRINLANPINSFVSDSLTVRSIFQAMQSEYDENTVVADIGRVRELLQYEDEASAIEVKAKAGTDYKKLGERISESLGDGFVVKDRFRQQEMNFRMVEIEKWVTFLLLVFILIIASFNLISTMCMLVLDKEGALRIYSALGMRKVRIGRIFFWESLYVSLGGGAIGICLGVILCLVQQHYGIIKLNANPDQLIVNAYPVAIEGFDILWALIPIIVIGIITSAVTSGFARTKTTLVT